MPEPLTISLGIIITKAVAQVWLGDDYKFAITAADTLADLAARVVPDWQSKSALKRQFEKISEKSAVSLEPLIEIEFSSLDLGEKKTAIYQVGKAIEETGLSLATLISVDYDVDDLDRKLRNNLKDSMLNEGGRHLCERLSKESATLITDLAAAMPNFERDNFAEVLRRETEIALSIDRIFSEIAQMREVVGGSGESADENQFELDYRRNIKRKLDRIELFGLNNTRYRSSRAQALSTAYISLSVTGSANVFPDTDDPKEVQNRPDGSEVREQSLSAIRAEEAALISSRVVIKGEAGSGKTTLLQSLAVRAASGDFTGKMTDWNDLIPFFVPLRSIVGDALPKPEELPEILAPSIAGTMPAGWVHTQLRDGRGLLLIDGLNEVSEEKRETTKTWIADLIANFPESKILMTSRPTAIPTDWLAELKFAEVELLPMSPDDVSMFIEHWHNAVSKEELDVAEVTKVRALAGPLRERIRGDRSLRELAATPLLCAMLCAMNRDRREVLPSNRISLYDAATQLVLHGRDVQRKVHIVDLPELDFETKRDLIQSIALWMMENGWSMAEVWRVEDFLQNQIAKFPRIPATANASLIMKALLLRSGVIRSPVAGKCDFIHNAFKEYLCARAISDEDKFGFLIEVLGKKEAWREVAPMAVAITDDRRRKEFLTEILKRGDQSESKRSMYHLLAVRCLETCTKLDPELQGEIHDRIQRLKPPISITEAKALSAAGDLAIDLVRKKDRQYARPAACCVRTLRMVGSERALDALVDYGSDKRGTVVKELLSAWPFFDRKEYARRVLAKSSGLYGGLRLNNLEGLEGVSYLSKLPSLRVSTPHRVFDEAHYSELDNLDALKSLEIRTGGNFNIGKMGALSSLKTIRIHAETLSQIECFEHYKGLKSVYLYSNNMILPGFSDLKLENLTVFGDFELLGQRFCKDNSLRSFEVQSDRSKYSLDFIQDQNDLTVLQAPAEKILESIDSLGDKKRISSLTVSSSSNLHSLVKLLGFTEIFALTLFGASEVRSLAGIEELGQLTRFELRGADNLRDISQLEKTSLKLLWMTGLTDALDLEPLSALPSGARVYISSRAALKMRASAVFEHLYIYPVGR